VIAYAESLDFLQKATKETRILGGCLEFFTEGNEGNEDSCEYGLDFLQKATKRTKVLAASVQQGAALQLHEIIGYSDRAADQLANAFGVNFHEPVVKNGISRMILPGANQTEDESKDISL
jgi:hypothetical protein